MLASPEFKVSFDDFTRMMEVTREDKSPMARALGMDQVATRSIFLPLGQTFRGFRRDMQRWLEGELVQNALPYLPRDDRAFLTSGVVLEESVEEV